MSSSFNPIDRVAVKLTRSVMRLRWVVILAVTAIVLGIGIGARNLEFANNYRVFFSKENPELQAFEALQATYTKNDNFLFVLRPADGTVFSRETLTAVESLTEAAWQIPYAIRVDSVSNFQHTRGEDDDLIVEDLVRNAVDLEDEEIRSKRAIALGEPLLRDQLIAADGSATAVNVVLQYPEQSLNEVPEAIGVAREIQDRIRTEHPDIAVYLTGVSALNNAFAEVGIEDMGALMPIMFAVILGLTFLIIRSLAATFATLLLIIFSVTAGMGAAGWLGISLTPISASAPIVILTLAIADSIHILVSLRMAMREGLEKSAAIIEALRLNFMPVGITSVTTAIGFLALNFSDSPPFWHLGNITAMGITAAWVLSITLLPALLSLLPLQFRAREPKPGQQPIMDRLADFTIDNRGRLLAGVGAAALALVAFIPTLQLNDQWIEYFSTNIEFRNDSDAALASFGLYPIEFSVPANGPGGVSEPEYLSVLDEFAQFLRSRPGVTHVYSFSDVMKRLNKNLHGDDDRYYRIPADRELSAQYLLLYEISLPYGLDLNDRINVDKSATRLTATLADVSSKETKAFLAAADRWLTDHAPHYMRSKPTSAQVMFTYIAERNVHNMVGGTVAAIAAISIILMLALRSVGLGLLSLVPNALPILVTFGGWALLVGEVGFSVATVASISLGIVVDDTVHFLAKYARARREWGLAAEQSIRYAFRSVGSAIVVNTVILAVGFAVLTASNFKVNADMGLLTAMAIVFALLLDFLLLPPLLLLGRGRTAREKIATPEWAEAGESLLPQGAIRIATEHTS
jgi:predicted RND superfamily exporter protein